jgi:transposase
MEMIYFIGVDVSQDWFDVALDGAAAKAAQFPNNEAGFAAFATAFEATLPQALVVCEATGGHEMALIGFLLGQAVRVHRATPFMARSFIRSLGHAAKTDALDAKALARLGRERRDELRLFVMPSKDQKELNELAMRRGDLVAQAMAEKTRLKQPRYRQAAPDVLQSVHDMLAFIESQIAAIEDRTAALIDRSEELSSRVAVLRSLKGIGQKSAIALQAFMPELGTLTRKTAASLAGCAPHPSDSGKTLARRSAFGGRATLKRTLFMAAMTARRCNPDLKAFYENLVAKGKQKMVALVAVMRKIIVIANAKLRQTQPQTTW